MFVKTVDGTFDVRFNYQAFTYNKGKLSEKPVAVGRKALNVKGARVRTTCDISTVDMNAAPGPDRFTRIAEGSVSCNPNDKFDKGVGRRLALTEALANTTLSQAVRKAIWTEYFAHTDHTVVSDAQFAKMETA